MQTLIRSNIEKRFVRWLFIQYKIAATSGTFSNYVATSLLGFIGKMLVKYLTCFVSRKNNKLKNPFYE